MKCMLRLLVGVGAAALLFSCATGEEAAGDKAYDTAKKASGDVRRTQLKTAYINYRKAVTANPNKVSTKLRNRFLEMCIVRANMVLNEGSATMDAIPLLMDDIEGQLKDDASSDLRQQYAAFLVQLGDSSKAKFKFVDALKYYDRAIEKAADAAPFREKRAGVIKGVVRENCDRGRALYEEGIKDKETGEATLIEAEYYAKVALYFDSTDTEAQKLLSDCYKANIHSLSAFLSVITQYDDTVMFRKINKYDILLSVTAIKGGTVIFRLHNNSFNPLRMRSEDFSLIDKNGAKYRAAAGSKIEPVLLDQERMIEEGRLNFPVPKAEIKKMVYENPDGPHYSEKNFY
jgi:tetratricopeptide (TPR) repeat protein